MLLTFFFICISNLYRSRYSIANCKILFQKCQNYTKNCNFIVGNHDWGQDKSTGARRCPMCLEQGAVVTLCMGCEPAFYVDFGPPTFAFNPCGHMATEKTVKYGIARLLNLQFFNSEVKCKATH